MKGWGRTFFLMLMFFPLSCWKSCFLVSLINIDEQRIDREIQNIKNLIVYRNRYIDISGAENTNVSSWDTNFLCKCFLCKTGTIKFLSQKRVTQTGFRNRPSFHLNHSWNNRIQTGNKIPILHPFLVYIMKKKIKKPAIMHGCKIKDIPFEKGRRAISVGKALCPSVRYSRCYLIDSRRSLNLLRHRR